jgi:MFS family permease
MTAAAIRRRYYLLTGSHTLAASLIWGVNTLFLLDSGLNIFQVFLVNAVFTAAMTLFEIPTGAVADSRGRKVSLQWSSVMLFAGTLGYLAAGTWGLGLVGFIAASSVLGLGFTFFSGAAEAWAIDELKALGDEENSIQLFANAATASSVTMLIGTIVGGLLGSLDYRIPYMLRAVLFILMLGLSTFAMPETGWKPDGEKLTAWERVRRTAADSVRFGLKQPALRQLMGVSFILGIFMMWGFYAFQPYITDLAGFPGAAWFSGLVTAGITLSQIIGQMLARRHNRKMEAGGNTGGLIAVAMIPGGIGALLVGAAGLPAMKELLGMPGAPILAIAGIMLMMGSRGYAAPFQRSALHSRIPSEKRATIVSLDSLVGSGGAIIGQPALGGLAGRFGIASGYLAGALFFGLTQPVLARFRRSERQQSESASD